MASATPAAVLGLAGKKGSLVAGADADLLVLGPALELEAVYRMGVQVRAAAGRSGR
jgi:N-acetylglucosamine-6-phosphate deacetylase